MSENPVKYRNLLRRCAEAIWNYSLVNTYEARSLSTHAVYLWLALQYYDRDPRQTGVF
jgi:hypothetical protein